jgi:hypothetical protein
MNSAPACCICGRFVEYRQVVHLVDLEPLFNGQHFGSDNTHADKCERHDHRRRLVEAMQENCIA